MPTAIATNTLVFDSGATITTKVTTTTVGSERAGSTLAVAKTGTLSTRTDNNTGILTMATGHGITTGARLDIYWDGGSRRGMVVGTVATNSVPIDLGAGDNLPVATTAITAQVPTLQEFLVTGDNVKSLGAKVSQIGQVVLTEADGTEAFVWEDGTTVNGGGKQWYYGNGATNPLAGFQVTKAYLSNGSSSAVNNAYIEVGF